MFSPENITCRQGHEECQTELRRPLRLRLPSNAALAPNIGCCNALLGAYVRAEIPQWQKVRRLYHDIYHYRHSIWTQHITQHARDHPAEEVEQRHQFEREGCYETDPGFTIFTACRCATQRTPCPLLS